MTAKHAIERRIADYYASEAPPRAPGRVLELAMETVERTPQRRRFLGDAWRFRRLNQYAPLAVAALIVVALGGLGVVIFRAGAGPSAATFPTPSPTLSRSPSPTLSPAPSPTLSPSPSPTIAPSPSPTIAPSPGGVLTLPNGGPLEAGTYGLAPGFPVPITFDVPDGWEGCGDGPVEQSVCRRAAAGPPGVGFSIIDNVVADPCGSALMNPPVGPSVDDLVTAISGLSGFEATAPVDVSVSGYPGKQFEVTAPASPTCNLLTWATSDRTNGVGAGEVNLLQILDVDGVRVLIAGAYFPAMGPADARAQIEEMLASVSIGR